MNTTRHASARQWTRRDFTKSLALAGTSAALGWPLAGCRSLSPDSPEDARHRKVAVLATEIRKYSHAQHFVDRILEGYGWEGKHHYPRLQLAGLYVDQFPESDLTPDRVKRHGLRLFPTVEETLTLGGSGLAVDGVLIIGEHGDYPKNEKGQKRYPRYQWFKRMVHVFESSGRAVPVFNDKHLSTDWAEAAEMVDDSRRLKFAFIAGSSLPVTWRLPSLDIPYGARLKESVCACYGGVDSYDFHGLETAQCMSERRAGGEAGVRRLTALRGKPVWDHVAKQAFTRQLLMASLARSHSCRTPAGYTIPTLSFDWVQEACPNPTAYFIEHVDGFQTGMFLLNGLIQDFNYAGRLDTGEILSTQFHLPMPPRMTTLADFFNPLMHHIETCILEERSPYPVERTLLTTGMTAAGVDSLNQQRAVETPEMAVSYQAGPASHFWRT